MSYPAPTSLRISLQPTERIGQAIRGESQQRRYASLSFSYIVCQFVIKHGHGLSNSPLIDILVDDLLIHIFYLYRPAILGEGDDDYVRIRGGQGWDREQWWYKLAHVCQRWRSIILGSASYLNLCLVCTYGTPVAVMLVHSPPLPLAIDYSEEDRDITAEDEEGIMLALEHHDRIRRVRFWTSVLKWQKLITAFDKEFPALEYLIMAHWKMDSTGSVLPEALQAPHLRHLLMTGFALPIQSRLLTAAVGLVTLTLTVHSPAYFQPHSLLERLSSMPQLEILMIDFLFPDPSHGVERHPLHTPIITHLTLPSLRWFTFRGASAYLEGIAHRITTPRLEKFSMEFFEQLTFSLPCLLQFMNTTENLTRRLISAIFKFSKVEVAVEVYPRGAEMDSLSVYVRCQHLDLQVSSAAQIFNPLSQIFTTVEHLALEHEVHDLSSEEHNEVDRTEWHKLLSSFSKVRTLRIGDGLIKEVSRSLRLDDGELPPELLPELQELRYSGRDDTGDEFKSFVDARQNTGHPVTVVLGQDL